MAPECLAQVIGVSKASAHSEVGQGLVAFQEAPADVIKSHL